MARAARKSTATRTPRRVAVPAATPARTPETSPAANAADAAAAGVAPDLAGGLRTFLDAIEAEVRAVTALSERIDGHVRQLNAARAEQAERLLALDALRASAGDGGLSSFLDKLIRPRMPRVEEKVPDRLKA